VFYFPRLVFRGILILDLGVTADDLQQYIKDFASQVNLRILVVGNMYKDEAIKIAETAEEGLGHSPLSADELNERALLLPSGKSPFLGIFLRTDVC